MAEMNGRNSFNVVSNAVRQVSANRCHIAEIVIHNDDSAARFLQMFNALSANITVGTTTPDFVAQIAADSTISLNMGGQLFATGFSYAVTTTATGNTGPTSAWVTVAFV